MDAEEMQSFRRLFIAALANKSHSLADDYSLAESVFISVTGFSLTDRVQAGEPLRKRLHRLLFWHEVARSSAAISACSEEKLL